MRGCTRAMYDKKDTAVSREAVQSLPKAAFFMEENDMKDENYIVIPCWMINRFVLKGNELLCYAIIYGFSQDGESKFVGSRRYLAEATCSTLSTIDSSLKSLVSKGLVRKDSFEKNGVVFNHYYANMDFVPKIGGVPQFSGWGPEFSCTDNIDDKIVSDKKEKDKSFSKSEDVLPFFEHETDTKTQQRRHHQTSKRTMTKGGEDFEKAWVSYGRKGSKKKSLAQWSLMSDEMKAKAVMHIPHYVRSRDFVYMKDFERYLRDAVFESPVHDRNGVLVYDASMGGSSGYAPVVDGFNLHWNEPHKVWVTFSNPENTVIIDGYTPENRPDCARVMYQGIVYRWDSLELKWNKE